MPIQPRKLLTSTRHSVLEQLNSIHDGDDLKIEITRDVPSPSERSSSPPIKLGSPGISTGEPQAVIGALSAGTVLSPLKDNSDDSFGIFVRHLFRRAITTLYVHGSDTVSEIRAMIRKAFGIPEHPQHLVSDGESLNPSGE